MLGLASLASLLHTFILIDFTSKGQKQILNVFVIHLRVCTVRKKGLRNLHDVM